MHIQKKRPKNFKRSRELPASQHTKISHTSKAIIETLAYKEIFASALSKEQLWNFFVSEKKPKELTFLTNLEELIQTGLVVRRGVKPPLYCLTASKCVDYKENFETSRRLLKKAAATTKYLKRLPWVRMIAITGSTAAFNSNKESDIDLLVVSSKNRLWLTRLFVVLVLKTLNCYWNEKKPAGTMCPNIFLTEANLAWPKAKRNVYTANEIALLFPIFYRTNTYFRFLAQNDWVTDYLPNLEDSIENARKFFNQKSTRKPNYSGSFVGSLIERLAMAAQKRYMRKKVTKEVISPDFIHFNKHDHTDKILETFKTKLLTN